MTNGVAIRKAEVQDVNAILRCLERAFAPYRDRYSHEAFADTALTVESLRRRLSEMMVLVAVDRADQLVGTVAYTVKANGDGHFRGMAVDPRSRDPT